MSPKNPIRAAGVVRRAARRRVVSSLTVEQLAEDWFRAQQAQDRSPETLRLRRHNIRVFVRFLRARGYAEQVAAISKRQVEDFLIEVRRDHSQHTLQSHYGTLNVFFNWCVSEDELLASPMARILKPKLVERPPDVLTHAEVQALLKTCSGKSFLERRNRAILLLLIDTGMRLQDVAQLTLDTVDREAQTLAIVSKGRRPRKPHYEKVAASALDAYLRTRTRFVAEHPQYAHLRNLWLGYQGALTGKGIYQAVKRHADQAGIAGVHPHLFRHGFAHDWLAAGGQEGDLARLAGWSPGSRMLYRYGAAQAEERAREAHKRLSPANRLGEKQ